MIAIPEHLEQQLLQIAELEHKPISALLEQALTSFLADYEIKQPNSTTQETFKKTDAGQDLTVCKNMDDMFNQLGI